MRPIKPLFGILLLLALPVVVRAQFAFVTNNGSITITGYSGPGGEVIIPDSTNGMPVTSIGFIAFQGQLGVVSVTIPDSVTNIDNSAFYRCLNLTNVTLGTNVTRIGNSAFDSCTNLISVTIPTSVTNIEGPVFGSCGSMSTITVDPLNPAYSSADGVLLNKSQTILIQCPGGKAGAYALPDTVTNISYAAFYSCQNLTNVTVGNEVITIRSQAFEGCSRLASINIPNSVVSIESDAFSACDSLSEVMIPISVTSIGRRAFFACKGLVGITVDPFNPAYSSMDGVLFDKSRTVLTQYPGGKTGTYVITNSTIAIGDYAFGYCAGLTGITIPDSVTSIGNVAFAYCTGLTSVMIPNSVTSIGIGPFAGCASLGAITMDALNSVYSCTNGVLFNENFNTLIQFPAGETGTYTVPNTVTSIAEDAFFLSTGLSSITMPNSVTNIGNFAFYYCTNLASVYFQGNAPKTSSSSFWNANQAVIYYLAGTMGWGSMFGGRPTAPWFLPNPLILNNSPSFGIKTNGFAFIISWATNVPVVVEACTDLSDFAWSAIATNTLTNGSIYFSDPAWTNYPSRFYRIRSP